MSSIIDSFDEHIKDLEKQIKEAKDAIRESQFDIRDLSEELESVKIEKRDFVTSIKSKNVEPVGITFSGWKDNGVKKKVASDWVLEHEFKYHPKVFGNYCTKNRFLTLKYRYPRFEFITATSDTNKIRYIVCVDCMEKYKFKKDKIWRLYLSHELDYEKDSKKDDNN